MSDADALTPDDVAALRAALVRAHDDLRRSLDSTWQGARPVGLDEPIGRLTRMDAMRQEGMTAASRRAHEIRLQQVEQALRAIDQGDYGRCRRCEDPIAVRRLRARPESPYCLDCQEAIDRKHG